MAVMKRFHTIIVEHAKRYLPWFYAQMLRWFMMILYAAVVVGYFAQFHWYFKTGIAIVDATYMLIVCYASFLIYFHFISVIFCGPGTSATTKPSPSLFAFDPESADLSATLTRNDCKEALTHIVNGTRDKLPAAHSSIALSSSTYTFTRATSSATAIPSSPSFVSTSLLPSLSPCRSCGSNSGPRPLRSRHCDACGVCVLRKDYHCSLMGTCIGKRNHTHFLVLLVWVAVVCSVYVWRVGSVVASTGCVPSLLYGVDATVQGVDSASAPVSLSPPVFPLGGDSKAVYGAAFPRALNHLYTYVSEVAFYTKREDFQRMPRAELMLLVAKGEIPVCQARLGAAGQATESVRSLRTDGLATVWASLFPANLVALHENSVLFLACCYTYMVFLAVSACLLTPLHLWLSLRDETTSHMLRSHGVGKSSLRERDADDKARHATLSFIRRLRQRVSAALSVSLSVLLCCCKSKRTPLVSAEEAELLWTLAAQRACAAARSSSATTATSLVATSTRSSPVDDGDSSDVWGDAREDAHLVGDMRQCALAMNTLSRGDVFSTGICGEPVHNLRASMGAAVEAQKRAWLREWVYCPSVGPYTPVEDLAYQRGWRGALHRRFTWNIPWQWRSSPQPAHVLSKNENYVRRRDDDDGKSAMTKLSLSVDTSSINTQDPESSLLRSIPVPPTPALLLQVLGACVLPVWTDTAEVETLHPWAVLLLEHVSTQARLRV